MSITNTHRKCFKEALNHFADGRYRFLCPCIDATSATEKAKTQCKELLFYYFDDSKTSDVLWYSFRDELSRDELTTCRMIALYTLIYAPL